jgi:hypothetical protein
MKALNDYLASIGVTYSARFVPQSKSRNRAKPELLINWRFTLTSTTDRMDGDFQQGISFAPYYNDARHRKDWQHTIARLASERGEGFTDLDAVARSSYDEELLSGDTRALSAPDVAAVLSCLVLDSSAKDMSFEEWCREYGYSDDSRSAERTYNYCVQTARDLNRVFTSEQLARLRYLLEGY